VETKNIAKLYLMIFVSVISCSLFSQNKHVQYSNQNWIQYYNQIKLNSNYSILFDVGIRGKSNLAEKTATLGRLGLQRKISNNVSVVVGGAYFGYYSENKLSRNEWRGWQEFSFTQACNRLNVQHRFRLEERLFYVVNSNSTIFNYRSRYRLFLTIPINNKTMLKQTFYLIAGDELFIDFGKDITYNFNQNRLLAGLGYKLNDKLSFSFTYVDQFARKKYSNCFERTNIFWIAITQKIELKKREKLNAE
jgi:hypothetical protein